MNKAPAELDAAPIATIFDELVTSVREKIADDDIVVDLELHFRSVSVEKRGFFVRNQKDSSVEIRLVTRIRR